LKNDGTKDGMTLQLEAAIWVLSVIGRFILQNFMFYFLINMRN
jgi:hypothetical protein